MRERDTEIKDFKEQISLHDLEISKWQQHREQAEQYTSTLEERLVIAREAQQHLDEQKQENLLLKETIDRMRFDMDELRTKAESQSTGNSNNMPLSQSSVGKNLSDELLRAVNESKDMDTMDEETVVEEIDSGADDTESEDVIQTIITHKKRVRTNSLN